MAVEQSAATPAIQEIPQVVKKAQLQVNRICHPEFAPELSGKLKPVEPRTLEAEAVRKGADGWALLNGPGKGMLVYDVVKDNIDQLGLGAITTETPPQQKLEMISVLFKQLEEKGFDPLVGKTIILQTADGQAFPFVPDASQIATALQVYAIDLGQQVADKLIEQPVASPIVTTSTEEITYKTHRSKHAAGGKIALTVGHSEDYKGTNLSEEQGSFWKVDRTVALETAGGTNVNYQTLSSEVNKSVGENKYGVFPKLQDRFAPAVEAHGADIAPRVLRLIHQRLDEKDLSEEMRRSLSQLIKGGDNYIYDEDRKVNVDRLKDALSILFPFKNNYSALVAEKGTDASAKQKRLDLKRKIQANFGEWNGVMFGYEGLQRTVAVDLRMGLAIEDVMVPDEITTATLEMKALVKKSRSLDGKDTDQAGEMSEILKRLQDRIDTKETDQQNLRDLHLMQQKAMLKAFNVKVGEKDVITTEDEKEYAGLMGRLGAAAEESKAVKDLIAKYPTLESLAKAISEKYEGLQSQPILEENTNLTLRLIKKNGNNLTEEQSLAIKKYLSAETFLEDKKLSAEYKDLSVEDRLKLNKLTPGEKLQRKLWLKAESAIKSAAELTEDDWALPKAKRNEIWAIIRSGDRVLSAVAQLGMDQAEFASQIDQWRMGGDILRMALKGIKARSDMGKFEKEEVVEHTTHRTKITEVPGIAPEKPTVEFPTQVIHYSSVQQGEGLLVVDDDGVVEEEIVVADKIQKVYDTNQEEDPAEGRAENWRPDLDAVSEVIKAHKGIKYDKKDFGEGQDAKVPVDSFELRAINKDSGTDGTYVAEAVIPTPGSLTESAAILKPEDRKLLVGLLTAEATNPKGQLAEATANWGTINDLITNSSDSVFAGLKDEITRTEKEIVVILKDEAIDDTSLLILDSLAEKVTNALERQSNNPWTGAHEENKKAVAAALVLHYRETATSATTAPAAVEPPLTAVEPASAPVVAPAAEPTAPVVAVEQPEVKDDDDDEGSVGGVKL